MTQDEINELEWGDCDNWAGPLFIMAGFRFLRYFESNIGYVSYLKTGNKVELDF